MNTIDQPTTDVPNFPHPCPAWCTVNHRHPLAQREEELDGERVHGFCVGSIAGASVWVNRVDVRGSSPVGLASVWAETEGDLNTEQSIRYAQLVAEALTACGPACEPGCQCPCCGKR